MAGIIDPQLMECDKSGFLHCGRWNCFNLCLVDCNGYVFVLDVETQAVEEAHVDVGDPDKGEPGDEIAAPAFVEHLEAGDDEKQCCDVVAEAVLAGEEVEEFAWDEAAAVLALVFAPVAGLAKNLFVGDGPGNTRYGECEDEEIGELTRESHEHFSGIQSASSEMQDGGLGLQDGLEEQTDSDAS